MARELPLWMQANMYAARLDRGFIEMVMRGQNRVFTGGVVTQRAAGADFTVDVSALAAVVLCTSQAFGGMWFIRSTAVENVAMPATPGAPRTDSVYAQVRDPNAGGVAGDDWIVAAIAGLVIPDNSILLGTVARTPGEPSIQNAAITDAAPRGQWAWTVSSSAPSGKGVPGDLWVVCA
jgi:hypothetical protein